MTSARVKFAVGVAFLIVTTLLWILAALFKLSVTPFFHAVLIKRIGTLSILGLMVAGPLVAAALGANLVRRRQRPVMGKWLIAVGGLLVGLFLLLIGLPLLQSQLQPRTPVNPQAPPAHSAGDGPACVSWRQGFGTRTPAGRGGQLLEVTTLADSGPGSLRAALDHVGPRIVVFRVGGTIELKEGLLISDPFVTVAGQTAPGGGICLKNAGLVVLTHDVLIQHIRIRPGISGRITPETNDAVAILGKHGSTTGAWNVVLDHVSTSWGEDETVSVWYGAHDITISNCVISEALNRARHEKRTHSAGLLIGDGAYHVSVHHCLLAHNDFRNPLISSGGTHDVVNNVIYNWGVLPAEIIDPDANTFLNFVGNYFWPGPSSRSDCFEILINPTRKYGVAKPKLFVQGNLSPHRLTSDASDWELVGYGFSDREPAPATFRSLAPFPTWSIATTSAEEAYEQVLSGAGATLPERDAVDRRIVAEVHRGGGRIIDAPGEVGGYPVLASGTPLEDADHDGMPDDWETAAGLDPHDPADGNRDRDDDGYTNIEEYLHCLLRSAN